MNPNDVGTKEYMAREHELAVTSMLIFHYNHGRMPRWDEMLLSRRAYHESFQDTLRLRSVGVALEVPLRDIAPAHNGPDDYGDVEEYTMYAMGAA